MAKVILIYGDSGTGKSTSLRNFKPNEISIFNVTNKDLPFKNKLPIINNATYEDIASNLINPTKNCYVIDDCGYLLSFSSLRRATEKGFDKWNEIAGNFFNMIDFLNTEVPNDIIVYLFMHEEIDEHGRVKCKTVGKMLDNQLFLEGMFTVVLRSTHNDNGFKFITRDEINSTVKSPIDMFEDSMIDNDLKEVDRIIREYYNMPPLEKTKNTSKELEGKKAEDKE